MRPARVVVSWMTLEAGRDPARSVTAALPAAERARAEAMPSRLRAREFTAARWLLRHALARRLGERAWSCALDPGAASPHPRVRWSVAHDGDVVAVAVADGAGVGIDVMRTFPDGAVAAVIGAVLERSAPGPARGGDPALRWMCAEAEVKLAGGWRAARRRREGARAPEWDSIVHTILAGPAGARAVIATTRPAVIVQRRVDCP